MRQFSAFWDTLAQTPLFAGIPVARVQALVGKAFAPQEVAHGELLFGPGDTKRALAILLEGTALVHKFGVDGHRVLMSRLSPGGTFGMASLFAGDAPYPTEVRAETACIVLYLQKAWLEAAFAKEPQLARNYIALLSGRIHFLNRRIETLTGDDVRARLLRLLGSLSTGDDSAFTLPYSLTQLAEMLGVGRATLYRAMDALESEGILQRDGRRITVQSGEKLAPY